MKRKIPLTAAACALTLLSLAGCGSDDDANGSSPAGAGNTAGQSAAPQDGLRTATISPPDCPGGKGPKRFFFEVDSQKTRYGSEDDAEIDGLYKANNLGLVSMAYQDACTMDFYGFTGGGTDDPKFGDVPSGEVPDVAGCHAAPDTTMDGSAYNGTEKFGKLQGMAYCVEGSDDEDGVPPLYYIRFDYVGEPYNASRVPTIKISYKKY